jgi:hypothetical protein
MRLNKRGSVTACRLLAAVSAVPLQQQSHLAAKAPLLLLLCLQPYLQRLPRYLLPAAAAAAAAARHLQILLQPYS